MKGIHMVAAIAATLLSTPTLAASSDLVERHWVKVDENHAELMHGHRRYLLDSYIVLFQQPYYIHIRAKDGSPVEADGLEEMAAEYIKPRGCTEPPTRRRDLDRSNRNGTELVLGYQC